MKMFAYGEQNIATDTINVLGKETRWDKLFHNILGARSATSLAAINPVWGAASQIGNIIGATTNQALKASIKHGNARFGYAEWGSAYKEFTTIYANQLYQDVGKVGLKSKFGQLTDLFGVYNESNTNIGDEIKKQTWGRRLASKDIFFFLKNGTELMLGSTTFLATAKSHYIKNDKGEIIVDGSGKKLNVMDAYVVNSAGQLVLREDLFDSNGNATTWSEFDLNRFRGYLQRTRRDIDGAYGSLDKSLLQRYWFGAALFWMKKFLVPFFENMYSKKRFNFEEGTHIEGFWRTTLFTLPDILAYIKASDTTTWNTIGGLKEYLTNDQKDAYRQAGTQVGVVITLAAIIMLVFGYDDEDEDRFKKMENRNVLINWLLYGMLKGSAEAESLIFPFGLDEAGKFLKNPVPQLVPYYSETMKLMGDFNSPFSKDPMLDRYKSGENKGDIKAVTDLFKMMGYTNSKASPEKAIKGLEFLKRQ